MYCKIVQDDFLWIFKDPLFNNLVNIPNIMTLAFFNFKKIWSYQKPKT